MTYITHLTINTGHVSRIQPGDVDGEALARVRPWLFALVDAGGEPMPLPVAALAGYTAVAVVEDGALIVTVYGQRDDQVVGHSLPLVSVAIARRSRHASELWPLMTKMPGVPVKTGLKRPSAPFCVVALLGPLAFDPGAQQWLGDFERCIAWAWIDGATTDA